MGEDGTTETHLKNTTEGEIRWVLAPNLVINGNRRLGLSTYAFFHLSNCNFPNSDEGNTAKPCLKIEITNFTRSQGWFAGYNVKHALIPSFLSFVSVFVSTLAWSAEKEIAFSLLINPSMELLFFCCNSDNKRVISYKKNSYSIIHTLSITHSFSLLIILKTWSYCCVSKVGYKRFLSACRRLKLLSINSFIMHESKSMNGWPTVPKNIFVKIPYYFLIDLWQEYYSSIFLFSEEKEGTQEEIQK